MRNFALFLLLLFFSPDIFAQQDPIQKEAILLSKLIEKNHYNPRPLNDNLSEDLFVKFLSLLDPRSLYFTEADVNKLSIHKKKIDNEMKGESWSFLPLVTVIYKQKLEATEKNISQLLSAPFVFSPDETITFLKRDSVSFSADEKALSKKWIRWLKFQALFQLVNYYGDSAAVNIDNAAIMKNEPAVREKIKRRELRVIRNIIDNPQGFEDYIASEFFRAFTLCFDPHSLYLSKTNYEHFEDALSRDAFSFGFDLSENEAGNVEIARLVPGGPAWKSNELHKGDILIELKWEGKPAVDLVGAELSEIENILNSSNSEKLVLTVRASSGETKTVYLRKEKLREDENIVKSYILNGEKRIGYISLPGFYSEWENETKLGCANDVAKEIVKLKQENIDGLILDVRDNGGGSLIEGLNLAGIFINEGPLAAMQGKDKKPSIMKDQNRGTIYDGPLILMVNENSASASEMLAAALQDYNRALIVGSPTFGKATAQAVLPIDTSINLTLNGRMDMNKKTPSMITLTFAKLYRVSGKSAQLQGVKPDILLPSVYLNREYGEKSYSFVLPSDSISKKIIYSPLDNISIDKLAGKSSERVSASPAFQAINKLSSFPSFFTENQKMPLTLEYFKKKSFEHFQFWENMENGYSGTKSKIYKVENTSYDKEVINFDSYQKEINDFSLEDIQSDFYLEESFQIISDLINLTKN